MAKMWTKRRDGWHYNSQGDPQGLSLGGIRADYFQKEIPPLRDGAGRPLRDTEGHIDMHLWAKEIEEQRAGKKS